MGNSSDLRENVEESVKSAFSAAAPFLSEILEKCSDRAVCFVPVVVVVVAGNK